MRPEDAGRSAAALTPIQPVVGYGRFRYDQSCETTSTLVVSFPLVFAEINSHVLYPFWGQKSVSVREGDAVSWVT